MREQMHFHAVLLRRRRTIVSLAFAALSFTTPATGQFVPFEPAPNTPAQIDSEFEARALRVVRFNACGRESEFASSRAHQPQGEDILDVIIAKIGFLRMSLSPCEETTTVEQPQDDNRSLVDYVAARFADFDVAVAAGTECGARSSAIMLQERSYTVTFTVSRACLRRQINEVLTAYRQVRQLGSSGSPCIRPGHAVDAALAGDWKDIATSVGDFDVDVRQLVRGLYLGSSPERGNVVLVGPPILDETTVTSLFEHALVVRGAPDSGSYSIYGCGNTESSTGTPEDYADSEGWLRHAIDDAGDELLDWWKFLLKVFLSDHVPNLSAGGAAEIPFAFAAQVAAPDLTTDTLVDFSVPETENHRLMLESSRWLTNQWMIDALAAKDPNYPNLNALRDQQAEVRDWLAHRLQDITKRDFSEYNSRAYQRYSINAIVNLYDFALNYDTAIELGSTIVLDWSAAKFAAGSSRARRFAPFRRLDNNDGYGTNDEGNPNTVTRLLYNYSSGADHQVPRFLVLAGQRQLIPGLGQGGIGELVNTAVSRYRLPDPIRQLALDRVKPVSQRIHHDGIELYYSTHSFLLTAGGVPSGPSLTLPIVGGRAKDRGVAMPTTLMLTGYGDRLDALFRFEGVGIGHERGPNTCVFRGFACGINFRVPDDLRTTSGCLGRSVAGDDSYWTMNSATCSWLAFGPHFYLVARVRDCMHVHPDATCKEGWENYGVVRIIDAPGAVAQDSQFDLFVAYHQGALKLPDNTARGSIIDSVWGIIEFDFDPPRIVRAGGEPVSETSWPLAEGDAIDSHGDGLIIIRSPDDAKTLTLDFRQWDDPKIH